MAAKERIQNYRSKEPLNIEQAAQESYYYHLREVGLRHPVTGASLRMTDRGNVELFAKGHAGMVLSQEGRSANLYGEHINIYAGRELKLNSAPLGLMWNFHVVNPDLVGTELLVVDASLRQALNALLGGGIPVTTPAGMGSTQPIPGCTGWRFVRPFLYDAKPQVLSDTVSRLVRQKEAL